jgi:hypothetical protein
LSGWLFEFDVEMAWEHGSPFGCLFVLVLGHLLVVVLGFLTASLFQWKFTAKPPFSLKIQFCIEKFMAHKTTSSHVLSHTHIHSIQRDSQHIIAITSQSQSSSFTRLQQPEKYSKYNLHCSTPSWYHTFPISKKLISPQSRTMTVIQRATNGVMVAATRQHVGKTTSCLAIVSKLIDLVGDVGFIKPVGQRHVDMDGLRVDKDVKLFKKHFGLQNCDTADMSPVVIPRGYTRKYLDGEITEVGQIEKIQAAFGRIASKNKFVVAEGTGRKCFLWMLTCNQSRYFLCSN